MPLLARGLKEAPTTGRQMSGGRRRRSRPSAMRLERGLPKRLAWHERGGSRHVMNVCLCVLLDLLLLLILAPVFGLVDAVDALEESD